MDRLILDGYNVIYKVPALKRQINVSLESSRNRLGDFMLDWREKTGFKGRITIVFDGQGDGLLDSASSYNGIEFLFSSGKSDADNYIITLLKEFGGRSRLSVVTDDNYIRNHCRVYQARCEHVEWLLSFLRPGCSLRKNKRVSARKGDGKNIPPLDALDINRYLKDIWNID